MRVECVLWGWLFTEGDEWYHLAGGCGQHLERGDDWWMGDKMFTSTMAFYFGVNSFWFSISWYCTSRTESYEHQQCKWGRNPSFSAKDAENVYGSSGKAWPNTGDGWSTPVTPLNKAWHAECFEKVRQFNPIRSRVFFWNLRWLKRKDFQCSIVVKNYKRSC